MEKAKRRRIVVVLKSQWKKECERRVRISIGAMIPGKESCFHMFLVRV